MEKLVTVSRVDLHYGGPPVIHHVSFDGEAGQLIGLVGPNGAGKTTLLLALSGQFRPAGGEIYCFGQDIYLQNLLYKKQISYVHESPFFYNHLTVIESLQFIARIKHVNNQSADEQIERLLQAGSLEKERNKLTSQLSFGMRKKLAIIAALMGNPRIIFLDEALNGVDIESSFTIKELLKAYVKEGGLVFLSTHIVEIVEKLCDRYLVLKNGELIADRPAAKGVADLEQELLRLFHRTEDC
ncbi:MAG: ABC transporter ATP-binding protein [Calditrichaeota bacterium]|nr:MAG: ABC transporter ATP-binding protein [Calditrichota bacterium]